jgi:hypothetical protein
MLQDLLKVQGEIVTLPTHQDKSKGKTAMTGEDSDGKPDPSAQPESSDSSGSGELVLSEEDSLWCQYRHKHIGTVMAGVNRKLKEFASSNKMAQYQQMQNKAKAAKSGGNDKDKDKGKDGASTNAGGGGKDRDSSVKDVLKAVAEMPEYKLQMRRYAKHVALAEECLSKFKNRHLALVGELEQSMASNSTPEGAIYPPGSRELREDLKALVLDRAEGLEGRPLGVVDKLRLVVIYSLVHGGLPPNLAKVLSSSLHPELLESVLGDQAHLRALGADLESMEVQVSRARIDELHERNAAQSLALMRYVPVLHGIMEALLRNQLPETQFPYTKAGGAPAGHHFSTANAVAAAQSQGLNSRRGSSTLPSPPGGGGSLNNSGSGLTAEEKRRAKLLAEAEMDVAHRATGRSARRQRTEASTPAAASTASAAAAAGSSSSAAASPALSRHASDGDDSSSATNGSSSYGSAAAQQPHRYIVFMLGGLTFSEMRSAYEVAAAHGTANGGVPDAPLLIGSTAALTPAEYLLDLSGLTRKEFFEKVLASASTAAAHSIASSEQAVRPVLNGQGQRSSRPLTQEELEAAERRGRNGVAHAVLNGGDEGEEDDEEDEHDDVSDPDSESSEDMGSPPPTATRGKSGGGGKSLMSSSAAKSRSVAVPAAAPVSKKPISSAAKAEPSTSKKPKKVKELVFESESDGDEDRTPTPPPPRSSKSSSKSAAKQQQASSAMAPVSSRNSKKGSVAREPSTKASRRRNDSDGD